MQHYQQYRPYDTINNTDPANTLKHTDPDNTLTKEGIPGPFGVKNGYTLKSSQKYTPRATRLAKIKSHPFSRDTDPGTPVNGYYALLSTVFLVIFSA